MDSDFPPSMWGWVGTGCGGIPAHPGCGYSVMALSLDPKRGCGCWYSSPVPPCAVSSCSTVGLAMWLCWVLRAWLVCMGREELKVPPNTQEV